MLNLTRKQVARGLLAPFVNVSFSGELGAVLALPEYTALCNEAKAKNVTVSLQEMAPTNSINLGSDALAVGFIANPHKADL